MPSATDCKTVRKQIREGRFSGSTSGLCLGYIQANVVILPVDFAEPFAEFCYHNPKPCPLLAVGDRGDPHLSEVGSNIDIRSDVAAYTVFSDGDPELELTSIADRWDPDFVTFALGCSHSFEHALLSEGIGLRHLETNSTVSMFRTSVETVPNEVFGCKLVVSMRPIAGRLVDLAIEISSRYPHSHGAPVHVGSPADLGISDINRPDWGDPVGIRSDEIPVFWACGVTSQLAISAAKPPIAITHRPGAMLITELEGTSSIAVPGLPQDADAL